MPPVLLDDERARGALSWAAARAELDGRPGERGRNVAHEAVDRHAMGPRGRCEALRWIAPGGEVRAHSYGALRALSTLRARTGGRRRSAGRRRERGAMNQSEIRAVVLAILGTVAPEARDLEIAPEVDFREQFDFASLDFLNFALALNERLGIELPESEYPKLSSLAGCVGYLSGRLAATADA